MSKFNSYEASISQIFDMLLITTSLGGGRPDGISLEESDQLAVGVQASLRHIKSVVAAAVLTKTGKEHSVMAIPIGIAWLTALREAERNLLKSEIIRKVANELAAADLSVRPSPSNN